MEVIDTPEDARRFTMALRSESRSIGLVPTMGALHDGHLSLVRISKRRCDSTVASIFVNPTQFGRGEDLHKYPRTFQQDCEVLEAEGVAAVFAPSNESMYPSGFSTYVDPPEVARQLEGVCRPGHFRGVTTVVMKLFHAMPATHAFFGKKDYQQWKVIEAMTRDLNLGIEIVACDTVREPDGLALSSRNEYLSDEQRRRALLLPEALEAAAQLVGRGEHSIETLELAMRQALLAAHESAVPNSAMPDSPGAPPSLPEKGVDKIDYAVVVDAETLSPLRQLDRRAVALIAAFVGATRLIDNRQLSPP